MSSLAIHSDWTMRFPAELDQMARLGEYIRMWADHCAPGDTDLATRLELAAHEIATNIVRHAYGSGTTGSIDVELDCLPTGLVVVLRDDGVAFDASTVTTPHPDRPQVGGYGLYLVNRSVDEVHYRRAGNHNEWRLTCRRAAQS